MNSKKMASYALVASVYTVLSLLVAPFSFGQIQVRLGEALMVLCLIDKGFVYALTLGCFLTNLIGVITSVDIMAIDILVGTLATYLAGLLVYRFRNILWFNKPIFSILWVAIINGIIVGLELYIYFGLDLVFSIIYVAIGEVIASALGLALYKPLTRAFTDAFK